MLNINDEKKYFSGKRFVDLFAGLGGFRLALESLGAKCVWSCDKDKHAAEAYKANFGDDPLGDITTVEATDVPDHDILCAGFPCQAFSISGKRLGFADTRGTLFFDVARIVKEKQPEIVLLENVKNFASHDGGNTIATIEKTMLGLGYSFSWKVMASNDYGAATKRERTYMVCFREDLNEAADGFSFPQQTGTTKCVKDVLLPADDPAVSELWDDRVDVKWDRADISERSMKPVRLGIVDQGGQGYRIYSSNGVGITLSANGGGRYARTGGYLIDGRVRSLAPREAARLMGFPDSYKMNPRRAQALKQFGNSVVVDMIQLVALAAGEAYSHALKKGEADRANKNALKEAA